MPDGPGSIDLALDLLDHAVVGRASDGRSARFPSGRARWPTSTVATLELIRWLGGTAELESHPNEIAGAVPFPEDRVQRPYDVAGGAVLRGAGPGGPGVQGVPDLLPRQGEPGTPLLGELRFAVTRFSGRTAPRHPGGVPGLPDAVTREAYSHEVSSAGFWPGGSGVEDAAFYSYAYPAPEGFAQAKVRPAGGVLRSRSSASSSSRTQTVRSATDPDAVLRRLPLEHL